MLICGICLGIAGGMWITFRKKLSLERKRVLEVLLIASLLGVIIDITEHRDSTLQQEAVLKRNQNGQGDYEQALEVFVEGYEEPLGYTVTVPERILTDEEQQKVLELAVDEIMKEFPGENQSVNYIVNKVIIREEYQEGVVFATWSFDNYDIVNSKGEVIADEISEEGVLVKAGVLLSCGENERKEEFCFRVFQEPRSEKEQVLYQIGKYLEKEGQEKGKNDYELPSLIEGKTLVWKSKDTQTAEKVLLLGIVIASLLPVVEHSRRKEKEEKRIQALVLEYPNLVNKLALLLGAGMTLQRAFFKIAYTYEEKRKLHLLEESPVYEEMLIACREMENGVGECSAYERFGERCGNADYRRLGNLLSQKVRKGNATIAILLEEEAERAFEARKAVARRYGEEAATKLLIPMVFMLGLVMIVLLVPAVMSFQI